MSGQVNRYTNGSSYASGAVVDGTYTFEPWQLWLDDQIDFAEFQLTVGSDGSSRGTASGHWESVQGDERFDSDFTATITGRNDDESPTGAARKLAGAVMPFDAIEVVFSEPVQVPDSASLEARAESGALPLEWTPIGDTRPGYVQGARLTTPGWWPPGEHVDLRIDGVTDAAGNVGTVDVGTATIAAAPDSGENPDFESGLDDWVTSAALGQVLATSQWHFVNVDGGGNAAETILPPQENSMAYVPGGTRLVGRFTAPVGATELCLTAGLLQSDAEAGGVDIDLILPEATVSQHFAREVFEPLAYPESNWSGFHQLCVSLPQADSRAFWLQITPNGYMPPIFMNDLLFDDVVFVTP